MSYKLKLDVIDDLLEVELLIKHPKLFRFEDEYDVPTLTEVSKKSNLPISDIILKGLFLELQELGIIITYENEVGIKNEVEEFCEEFIILE